MNLNKKNLGLNAQSVITNLHIYWQNKLIYGNNQQILLDQLEQAGIHIYYSCRIGICGCCKVKLVKGKVSLLKQSAIYSNGTILCCSCIPQMPLQLEL